MRRIAKDVPRSAVADNSGRDRDPIVDDLMKLSAHEPLIVTKRGSNFLPTESINHYSSHLSELLYLLNEERELDDTSRMSIEGNLFELTSYIPKPCSTNDSQYRLFYPNEQLSKILIDNYAPLLKFSSSYFNLSLASHITKYMVELVYMLQYWEVYHLLYLLPDLDYFLKLVGIEVIQTPFGPLVRPPENLMVDSMSQGLQYPFPYPFYNYSYHSLDPTAKKRKFSKVNITPYIDITLTNLQSPKKKKQLHSPSFPQHQHIIKKDSDKDIVNGVQEVLKDDVHKQDIPEFKNAEIINKKTHIDHNLPEEPNVSKENEKDQENEIFDDPVSNELDVSYVNQKPEPENRQEIDKSDNEYEIQSEALASQSPTAENTSRNAVENNQFEIRIIHSGNEKGLTEEEAKKNKSKSGVIHQCHLMDPHTMKACLKIFYGKNELLRHQEFVHATKKKIYKCIYCSRNGTKVQSYPRHDSLARHIRRKHGITGKENKMAVNYAKENVEVIDDPSKLPRNQNSSLFGKPLPRPQFLNSDFTIKSSYAGFLLFSTRDGQSRNQPGSSSSTKSKATTESELLSPQNASVVTEMSPEVPSADKSPNMDTLSLNSHENVHSPSMSPPASKFNVNSVNFNKPEASAIKENFQKFRLANPALLHTYQFESEKGTPNSASHTHSMDVSFLNSTEPDAVQKLLSNEELSDNDLIKIDPYNLPSSIPPHEASKLQNMILALRKKREASKSILN